MPHRCAFGCKNTETGVVLHVMPNPAKFPERFQAWVRLLGGKLETPSDYELYKKKRVCDIHFSDEHRNRYKRLNALAVPTLNLPGSSVNFPAPVHSTGAHEHTIPAATLQVSTASISGSSANFPAPVQATGAHEPTIPAATRQISTVSTSGSSANFPAPVQATGAHEPTIPTATRQISTASTSGSSANFPAPVQATGAHEPTIPAATRQVSTASTSGSSANFPAPVQATGAHEPTIPAATRQVSTASTSGSSANFPAPVQATGAHEPTIPAATRQVSTASTSGAGLKHMQRKIKYLRNEICRLRKRGHSYKERLVNATKLSNDIAFQRVIKNMTKPAQLFVHMQLQSTKKPKGRRFTLKENILASSLFKKSPKCYRLLCKYFTLPSSKTMRRLLSRIKLSPGINNIIFDKIKNTVRNKDSCDRLCNIIFDEMSLTPQVTYNSHKDAFEGFACNAGNSFADHVLVFMVKGITCNFKQPIAYYFTNSLSKFHLKQIIISVIKHTTEAGLIVVSTVCDQSPVNVGAINELVNDTKALYLRLNKQWRHDMFRLNKQNIIPLYDTPHLIKGLRNNLITKDLSYTSTIDKQAKIVKWDYYQMVYAADKSYGELRLLNNLTEAHVNPEKINKMRVKTATQLFSHSVAVVTEHLTGRGDLPNDCRNLIHFTIMIDNLFDSLNGNCLSVPNGKIYKGPVKRNSPHHQLWREAKEMLKSTKYLKKVKVGDRIRLTETIAPSVTNFIKTIEGMESLWNILSNKYGLDAILTRNLNQDPVENFFGSIRSYGIRNIAPNTVAFEGAFKALMLNNCSSPHSIRANCEEDQNECLQSFEFFLTETTPDVPEENDTIHFNNEIFSDQLNENDAGQANYVCGWVIKKCLKQIVKSCQHCKLNLLDNKDPKNYNTYIRAKEYQNKNWLCYPSEEVATYFKEIQNVVTSFLKRNMLEKKIKANILIFLDILTDGPFTCPNHKNVLKSYFTDTSLNVLIYSWCRSVNRILTGKLKYDGEDEVKNAAQIYYNKHKNYKNRK